MRKPMCPNCGYAWAGEDIGQLTPEREEHNRILSGYPNTREVCRLAIVGAHISGGPEKVAELQGIIQAWCQEQKRDMLEWEEK